MTTPLLSTSESAVEARARRAARRIGLSAVKSKRRTTDVDNYGGFMLVDEFNVIQNGLRFDMSAEEVIAYCKD